MLGEHEISLKWQAGGKNNPVWVCCTGKPSENAVAAIFQIVLWIANTLMWTDFAVAWCSVA